MKEFKEGLIDGIPVCFGYLSVSFAFGIMVAEADVPMIMGVLMSMTNLTSAGQFAGLQLMAVQASMVELAITTFVINLRYSLMSLSLTQKLDQKLSALQRGIVAFGITDELFALAMNRKGKVTFTYYMGLLITPYFGWALGTFLGATVSNVLPPLLSMAMNVALYGMFIAIIIPVAKENRNKRTAILFAIVLSCIFAYGPLKQIGSGWTVIIITVVVSGIMAVVFPNESLGEGR